MSNEELTVPTEYLEMDPITAKAARTKPKQFDQDPLAMILKDA